MTFASTATKRTVLARVRAEVESSGYTLYSSEKRTLRTQFRRSLTEDVVVGLQVDFFDGGIASANRVHMNASFGIASKKLLAIYYELHNESLQDDYLPIGGSLQQWAPNRVEGSWSFEVPVSMEHAQHFGATIKGALEDLLRNYDSAEKQISMLLPRQSVGVHWNDYFFEPIGHLYLGNRQEAVATAKRTLEAAPNAAFRASYAGFYKSVIHAAA